MQIINDKIRIKELNEIAKNYFGNLVKAVVDVDKKIIAIDAEMHADEEAELLSKGSAQKDLWGINLYPELIGDDFIEFDSMINLRPSQGNKSRGVDDEEIRKSIIKIVNNLIINE